MDLDFKRTYALCGFRSRLHGCFGRRSDALFELTNANLSLKAVHRRGWGSLYAALSKGKVDENAVRDLLACYVMARDGQDHAPVFAVDVTSWPPCDADASPERGYYYHPSRHSAGQPIVAGWAYQLIAQFGFARDTWVGPVDVRQVHPAEDASDVGAEQAIALLARLRRRSSSPSVTPLFVFDAGYDPVKLQRELKGSDAQLLIRLHSNRVFYADPEQDGPRPMGRPRRHGAKFDLHDPETWPEPSAQHRCETDAYGPVLVRTWTNLHPKTRRIGARYGCERAPVVKGTVILVEVSRLPGETRKPKKLWMWWHGEGEPTPHPRVVVQDDVFNRSRVATVVVCALTSSLRRANGPGNVLLEAGEGNPPSRASWSCRRSLRSRRRAWGNGSGRCPTRGWSRSWPACGSSRCRSSGGSERPLPEGRGDGRPRRRPAAPASVACPHRHHALAGWRFLPA